MPSMPPPKPPQFLPPFQGILRLVQCSVLHQVLHSLFSRAATPGLKYWSDKLLHEVRLGMYMPLSWDTHVTDMFHCALGCKFIVLGYIICFTVPWAVYVLLCLGLCVY